MPKLNLNEVLSFSKINERENFKPTMLMIIDIDCHNLNISNYLERHDINVFPDIYKQSKKISKCKSDVCASLYELIMIKELIRDEKLFDKINMGSLKDKNVIISNGHLVNMAFIKMTNKNIFKHYMREFKHRKHSWNYIVVFVKDSKKDKTDFNKKLLKELKSVLKQSQIEPIIINKIKTNTMLRKEILKYIKTTYAQVE